MEETAQETPAQKSKSMTPIIIAVIVVLVLIAGYVGYKMMKSSSTNMVKSAQNEEKMEPKTEKTGESMNPTGTSSASADTAGDSMNAPAIVVTGSNYSFSPSTITVKKGQKVTITFKNSGGFHNFVLDEFNVKTKTIPSGAEETVTFTADKAGTFEYYCAVANHRAMGMKGTLTVTE